MLVLDTTIFGLTFAKAVQHGRTWQGRTLQIMLRDGETINTVLSYVADVFAGTLYFGSVSKLKYYNCC